MALKRLPSLTKRSNDRLAALGREVDGSLYFGKHAAGGKPLPLAHAASFLQRYLMQKMLIRPSIIGVDAFHGGENEQRIRTCVDTQAGSNKVFVDHGIHGVQL